MVLIPTAPTRTGPEHRWRPRQSRRRRPTRFRCV